ncbi:hypothetical protein ACFQ4O_04005 [Methylopila musalis]|uniref:Uncharacterized protein n=1 Tax=Methylopila musalis TaxID=1134781 RepID=A0ABW3Z4F0_9HYPH
MGQGRALTDGALRGLLRPPRGRLIALAAALRREGARSLALRTSLAEGQEAFSWTWPER